METTGSPRLMQGRCRSYRCIISSFGKVVARSASGLDDLSRLTACAARDETVPGGDRNQSDLLVAVAARTGATKSGVELFEDLGDGLGLLLLFRLHVTFREEL